MAKVGAKNLPDDKYPFTIVLITSLSLSLSLSFIARLERGFQEKFQAARVENFRQKNLTRVRV